MKRSHFLNHGHLPLPSPSLSTPHRHSSVQVWVFPFLHPHINLYNLLSVASYYWSLFEKMRSFCILLFSVSSTPGNPSRSPGRAPALLKWLLTILWSLGLSWNFPTYFLQGLWMCPGKTVWGNGRPGSLETKDLVSLVPGECKPVQWWEESLLNNDDVDAEDDNGYYLHLLVLTFLLILWGFFLSLLFP